MKNAALILASVAAFDLGVMAVAAQANPGMQNPPTRSDDFVNQGLITNSNSKIGAKKAEKEDGPVVQDSTSKTKVYDPTGTGGCTPGSPLSGGTSNPCAPSANALSNKRGKHFPTTYIRVDKVNTIKSCTARGGEVILHQGVQQCRISAPETKTLGNPRPGASPPKN